MAARSGTGRSLTSSSSQPSYEDMEPKSAEWKEEKTAHILNVHLPGFVKEQIRVTYDDASRSFNVRGERPLGNNRFVRLNKDFTMPDNCKMKDMDGKFQDEVLTITIPKEYVSPFFGPKETTKSAQSQPISSSSRPSYEDIEPKSAEWKEEKTAHILNAHLPGFVKENIRITYDDASHSFNVRGDRPLGNNRFGRLNKDFTVPDNCKMKDMEGKFKDEVLTITIPKEYVSPFFGPKETNTSAQSPPENASSITHKPPAISEPQKVPPSMPPPETAFSSTTKQPGRQSDHEKLEYPKREPNGKSLDPNRPTETMEKETKRAKDTDVAGVAGKEMMRPKNSDLVRSKAGESESVVVDDGQRKKKKREGKVGEAEKQLIVNVGVASLVLVALGAYVGYNFACPRSAKD